MMRLKHFVSTFKSLVQDAPNQLRWSAIEILAPRKRVKSRGLEFTLSCNNWITHFRWGTFNLKEPETLDWMDNCVKDRDVFFDVGANVGLYSIYAALRHPLLQVIAFEPEYSNLHLLRDNIIANKLPDQIEVYSIALGHKLKLSHLHIQDFTPEAALHTECSERVTMTREKRPAIWREGIVTMSIDRFCEETQLIPNCIKIDVDGNEEEILKGGEKIFCSPQLRTVLLEIGQSDAQLNSCSTLLKGYGLKCTFREGEPGNQIWIRA